MPPARERRPDQQQGVLPQPVLLDRRRQVAERAPHDQLVRPGRLVGDHDRGVRPGSRPRAAPPAAARRGRRTGTAPSWCRAGRTRGPPRPAASASCRPPSRVRITDWADLGDGQLPAGDRGDGGERGDAGDDLDGQAERPAPVELLLHARPRAPGRRSGSRATRSPLGGGPLVERRARPRAAAATSRRSRRRRGRGPARPRAPGWPPRSPRRRRRSPAAARSVSRSAAPGPAPTNPPFRCDVTACLPARPARAGTSSVDRYGQVVVGGVRPARSPRPAGRGAAPSTASSSRPCRAQLVDDSPAAAARPCRPRPCRARRGRRAHQRRPGGDRQQRQRLAPLAEHGAAARGQVLHRGDAGHGPHPTSGRSARTPCGQVGEGGVDVRVADGGEGDDGRRRRSRRPRHGRRRPRPPPAGRSPAPVVEGEDNRRSRSAGTWARTVVSARPGASPGPPPAGPAPVRPPGRPRPAPGPP